ncbi:MAG TPA: hypothetical protein VF195_04990 [Actinomycetota bacterium]
MKNSVVRAIETPEATTAIVRHHSAWPNSPRAAMTNSTAAAIASEGRQRPGVAQQPGVSGVEGRLLAIGRFRHRPDRDVDEAVSRQEADEEDAPHRLLLACARDVMEGNPPCEDPLTCAEAAEPRSRVENLRTWEGSIGRHRA